MNTTTFAANVTLMSPAFEANTAIPKQYTCSGADKSPPLIWQNQNPQTKSYALIVSDPDAPGGNWNHWVLFNIPAQITQLEEGAQTPEGAISGTNSWNVTGYKGPCPPSGTHHYVFTLYVLDTLLKLTESATDKEVMQAMQNHILDQVELTGFYTQ